MKKITSLLVCFALFISCFSLSAYAMAYDKGDVNGDNLISAEDYVLVKKHVLGLQTLTGTAFSSGDMDSSGTINASDIVALKKLILMGAPDLTPLKQFTFSDSAVETEAKFCFEYLMDTTITEYPATYGLVSDNSADAREFTSAASTGFGLTALPIGVEAGWMYKKDAQQRALKALTNLERIQNETNQNGFFYHFIDGGTGKPYGENEISIIDTSLLVCGVISVGEYFGGAVKVKADAIYSKINWKWFVNTSNNLFYMSNKNGVFEGKWDKYDEGLMMYILAAGSPNSNYRISKDVYYQFDRNSVTIQDITFNSSWFNSAFTYQFSHAWIDFRNKADNDGQGTDWFANSVKAAQVQVLDSRKKTTKEGKIKDLAPTLNTGEAWGLSATWTPFGYIGNIGLREGSDYYLFDVVSPYSAVAMMPFTPSDSLRALKYYQSVDGLSGKYGLYESYTNTYNSTKTPTFKNTNSPEYTTRGINNINFGYDFTSSTKGISGNEKWVANRYYGIDKGITLLMLANYEMELPQHSSSNSVWDYFMTNEYVQSGMNNLGFK